MSDFALAALLGFTILVASTISVEIGLSVALIELALRGVGVAYVPEPLAQSHLERGALVPVLRDHMPREHWLYAAYSQRRHNSAAMRAMLDYLEQSMDALTEGPALPPPMPVTVAPPPPVTCASNSAKRSSWGRSSSDVGRARSRGSRIGSRAIGSPPARRTAREAMT